ncbi:MAG TPA: Holliday junction DNA helicase RuvB C-terminal domain-containing protein, partial [Syntrophorhabdaceae bacterium]|nr:Holliday junction DNA helicase RuvB C-terminal domain-containing protein [Syntrophorhabdaceae bacterium]
PIDEAGAHEIAKRARGTPRVANRLLKRVRDYAQVKADGIITKEVAIDALTLEGIDDFGLGDIDRKLLETIIVNYKGGPVGIEALSATLQLETDVLIEVIEPYLLKTGFIIRTSQGRKATEKAYKHLRINSVNIKQKKKTPLFD